MILVREVTRNSLRGIVRKGNPRNSERMGTIRFCVAVGGNSQFEDCNGLKDEGSTFWKHSTPQAFFHSRWNER